MSVTNNIKDEVIFDNEFIVYSDTDSIKLKEGYDKKL